MAKTNHVEFAADFSPLVDSIGTFEGMAESIKSPVYTDELLRVAHGVAEKEFNVMAAAQAATGSIAHMYEWGTQGINRGRSNMRPNPMDPRARLWTDVFIPSGLGGTLAFEFKPSIGIVPKPTTAATGISKDVIKKMSDHVFHWKARVMEMGETVTIVPKQAKMLMIPIRNGMTPTSEDYQSRNARGYVMTKGPVTAQPGRNVAGNFSQFWLGFWESRGNEIMDQSIETMIREDFEPGIEVQGRGPLRPPVPSIRAAVAAKSRKVAAEAKVKARTRRRAGERNNAR
jgi:hypothetical protein